MSAFDYAATASEAGTILDEFGMAVTLSRPSTSAATYDVTTGVSTPVSAATYAGRGALFDYAQTDMNASMVKEGDQRCLMSVYQTDGSAMPEPNTGDLIVAGSTSYRVQRAGKISPAGILVLFDLHLRGV